MIASRITIQEPMKAIAYFLMIFVGLGILLAYVALEHPGISAADWRSSVSPYHPANPPTHLVTTGPQGMAVQTVEKIKHALDNTVEGQAQAAGN